MGIRKHWGFLAALAVYSVLMCGCAGTKGAGMEENGQAAAKVVRRDGVVTLSGLQRHPGPMSQAGCLVACAEHLGVQVSPAWISGCTGFAFAINVGEDLCPSGPSAWADHKMLPLAANAGLRVKGYLATKKHKDFTERRRLAFERVKRSIDAGRPVIGCEMVVPEVYLVIGYDDDGNYRFIDFDDKVKTRPHDSLGFVWMEFPTKVAPADDRSAVGEALVAAVGLAAGKYGHGDGSSMGPGGYDNWIKGLEAAEGKSSGFGMAYNAACWSECRRHAPTFLAEARERLADETMNADFDKAIARYALAGEQLKKVSELFPFTPADEPAMDERFKDPGRRKQAARALRAARRAEVEGVKSLAQLAAALGAESVE